MPVFKAPHQRFIKDVNNTIIPFEFYSEASNVRFADSAAKRYKYTKYLAPTVAPYCVTNWSYDVNYFGSMQVMQDLQIMDINTY